MYDKGMIRIQPIERIRHQFHDLWCRNADHLKPGASGICERPKNVEHGAHLQLHAGSHDMFHRGVEPLRKQEPDTCILDRAPEPLDRHLNIKTKRFHHIRTSAPACRRSVAVLGDAHSGGGRNEGRGCRNVEGTQAIAACSGRIQYRQNLAIPQRLGLLAHNSGKSDQLLRCFTLHSKCRQKPGNLRICRLA